MHDRHVSCDTKLPLTSISTSYMDMSISDFISDKTSPLQLISDPCVIENFNDKGEEIKVFNGKNGLDLPRWIDSSGEFIWRSLWL